MNQSTRRDHAAAVEALGLDPAEVVPGSIRLEEQLPGQITVRWEQMRTLSVDGVWSVLARDKPIRQLLADRVSRFARPAER